MKSTMLSLPRVFASCLAVLMAAVTHAAEYHVSPDGSDKNAGTRSEPFRSVQRAADIMAAGDTCIIHAGTYRETVRPANSGTEDKSLVFSAAPGEQAVVSGADPVTGWTVHSGAIWKASVDWPVDQVFLDGKIMVPARFPNTGSNPWEPAFIDLVPSPTNLACELLAQPKDFWKGAKLWGLSRRLGWVASTASIQASEPRELPMKAFWFGGGAGRGYLYGTLAALDADREWHCENGTLYFQPPERADPARATVEATRRRWAFDLSERRGIEVRGLRIFAAGVNMDRATNCVVESCRVRWPCVQRDMGGGFNRDRGIGPKTEGLGIALGGSGNTVRNCVIAFSTGDGVSIWGAGNTVENCVIHDCDTSASDCAPITCTGTGHAIVGNTLFNGGRSILVHRHLKKGRIERNHMFNAGLLSNDLGMTYTYQTVGEGTVIAYNVIHHNFGRRPGNVGIYLDDMSSEHVIHHNLVYGVSEALALNPPRSMKNCIFNNTLDGYVVSLGMSQSRSQDMTGTRIINNILTHYIPTNLPNAEVGTNLFRETDARFVDVTNANYQLAADSPAIDAGIPLPPYTDGFAGKAPDMGAFEYGKKPWDAGSLIPRDQWDMDPDWAVAPDHKGPCYDAGKP